MFKITSKRVIEWPVQINEPQSGGKVSRRETKVEFEHLAQDDFDAIYNAGGGDKAMLKRVVTGWKDNQFQDEAGQDLPFTPENLDLLLGISYVRLGFVSAYLEIQGGREAARKN